MKNLRFLTLGLALVALLFTACKKDDNNGGEQAPQKLTLEKSAVTVKLTESAIVRITAGNGGYKVESADKNIATAAIEQNNVKISAIAEGQTTLTVSDAKGQKAAIAVTVESNIDPSERLSVEKQTLTLVNGEEEVNRILNAEHNGNMNLSFTISPAGSVSITVETRIVNGNPDGKNLRVKALKVGTAQIAIKDNTNNQTTSFKVTVTAAELTVATATTEIETEATTEVRINTGNPDYTVKAKNDIFEVDGSGVVTLKAGATAKGAIKIPDAGTSIGAGAFRNASEITSIDFNNVTEIGASAFLAASKLSSITMNNVSTIKGVAFANCTALKTITVKTSTPPTITNTTFFKVTGATVYVPKGAKTAYENDSLWKKLGTIKELEQ